MIQNITDDDFDNLVDMYLMDYYGDINTLIPGWITDRTKNKEYVRIRIREFLNNYFETGIKEYKDVVRDMIVYEKEMKHFVDYMNVLDRKEKIEKITTKIN